MQDLFERGVILKIALLVDEIYEETKITIECNEIDDDIQDLINYIKEHRTEFIIGKDGDTQHIIKPDEVHYFHTENNAVVAITNKGSFILKEKLYELENSLSSKGFIRLSKSVIANIHEIARFEASFNGTLCVYFKTGEKEYVTRTYVKTIKEAFKMKRRNQ